MASTITAYRVFIASPGGLDDEREHFRAVIQNYNEQEAIERGVIFLPIGWEMTLGGVGRPQQTINEDVRRCDYFVMLLWDRWGSPTAGEGAEFSSGSAEEYSVACACHESGTMRQIVVLFKDVDPERRRDPGLELANVLSFKQRLEEEKTFMYETFDEPGAFRERLRRHLSRWVRAHEEGALREPRGMPAAEKATVSLESPADAPRQAQSPIVRRAEKLASEGRVTEAEQAYAKALPKADLDSLNRYGAFLAEKGSLATAEEVFTKIHDLAQGRNLADWVVTALNNLGSLYVAQGKFGPAEESYLKALALREQTLAPDHPDVAASLNNLAELYASQRRFDEAEAFFKRALVIQGVELE
jgi:Tfp pilus assembly protein PilF